jgi:hypothetical protein
MAVVFGKQGSAHLGCNNPAIRFKALARASPSGFTLLSGLFNQWFCISYHCSIPADFKNLLGLTSIK